MNLAHISRRKKTFALAIGVMAVAIVGGALMTSINNQGSVGADQPTENTELDSAFVKATDVSFKAVGEDGSPRVTFLDAFFDTDGDCTAGTQETDGYTGETDADGKTILSLPDGRYVIRAVNKQGEGEGLVAIAVGTDVTTSCAQAVTSANAANPISITVK